MTRTTYLMAIITALIFGGCATGSKEQIYQKSVEQGKVFEELSNAELQPGYVVLTIKVSMKTPKEGYYPLEPKHSLHGKPQYPFIFNIGGQGVTWLAKGTSDTQPGHIDGNRNPEGGEGVKYTLEKKIMLKPGVHKIYLGLTEEKFQKEIAVKLTEQRQHVLEFSPVYRRNKISGKSFYAGISSFEVFLNGKRIGLMTSERISCD